MIGDKIRIVAIIGGLLLLGVLALAGYFAWLNIANVDTLRARVDGPMAVVRAPTAGRVADLTLDVGDAVLEGEAVAMVQMADGQGRQMLVPLEAPLTGIVTARSDLTEQRVTAGQPLLTIVDPETLWITVNIHESRIPQVQIGQRVRIRLRTRTMRRIFWGEVEQIGAATTGALQEAAGAPSSATGPAEIPVRVSIDPQGYPVYPGMTADVRIRLSPRSW
jgi:multidrug resistance efflux pump